jgi:hypothetical protein
MDESYTEPFIEAGDGGGLEAWNQSFAQLARVSEAVDVSMESLFILPWSGQTNPPASGPNQATVELTISRTGLLEQPLILGAGLIWVDDIEPDYSPTGTQLVNTGLRYYLSEDVVFEPGEMGPLTVTAIAERPGYSYNAPFPGMLNLFEQPGTGYNNIEAAVTANVATTPISKTALTSTLITCIDVPHVFIPALVGQYITVTQGTNAGQIARINGYTPPPPSDVNGGSVSIEQLVAVHATSFSGTFDDGELVVISGATTGYATFKHDVQVGSILKASFVLRCGTVAVGSVFTGVSSGAVVTASLIYDDASTWVTTTPAIVPSTEQWRILDWANDWGLTVTNAAQPSGGTAGVLDLLGRERNMPRLTGEDDTTYRTRIAAVADVVTPNAIKRRLNRVLTQGPLGLAWCFREIGTPLFPGFFYGDGSIYGDFYDYDCQMITGLGGGSGYQLYEPVTQTVGGIVATGKILIKGDPPAIPFVPGQAETTGRTLGRQVVGVAGARIGYSFVAGSPIVGTHTHFHPTPTGVTPSSGQAYVNGNGVIQQSATGATSVSTLWRIYVDYLRMRAYFVVTVQRSDDGDFGFAWGSGAPGVGGLVDFWDTGPGWDDFYDGGAIGAAGQYLSAYGAVNLIRAGGVTVEFLPTSGPCV